MDNQHQDVIRILSSSTKSFDDAVQSGIQELLSGPHHKNLRFTKFEIVRLQGTIEQNAQDEAAIEYQALIDVTGHHVDVEPPPV
jgi:flavin-binding protein dodecin